FPVPRTRLPWLRIQQQPNRFVGCSSGKRRMASEQFVENRAESVDICGAADSCIVTDRLLGRHVTGRSHYLLRARDGAPMFHQPGEAEISQVRFAVSVQQNISWLDVSMQNAVFVCVCTVRATFAMSSAACRVDIGP